MQKIIMHVIYVFLVMFILTVGMAFFGLYLYWSTPELEEPPYLRVLLYGSVIEVATVISGIAYKGLKYFPKVEINKNKKETLDFMEKFISSGSTVTVVSNRAAWLKRSLIEKIKHMAENRVHLEIITPSEVSSGIKEVLEAAGVQFYVTNEEKQPSARFTLVDGNRSGSERLAIAKGTHPNHEITIFDNDSGPQLVAMARDIIRKSKELANVNKMV